MRVEVVITLGFLFCILAQYSHADSNHIQKDCPYTFSSLSGNEQAGFRSSAPTLNRESHIIESQAVSSFGVIGAGMMGTAITALHVKHKVPVIITDNNKTT